MRFHLGQEATLTYTLTVDENPTDATVTLTVTSPTGQTSSPAIGHPDTGVYTAVVVVTEAGEWDYTWAATGATVDTETGSFSGVASAPLVTVDDYRRITRDTTTDSATVAAELDAAEQLVADYLRRPGRLAHGTYTDRLRLYTGEVVDGGVNGSYVAYPIATPVESVDGGLVVINSRTVGAATPDGGPFLTAPFVGTGVQPYATITYTGGWTAETLPETVRREIAKTAQVALHANSAIPAGATSARLGDAAVTFRDPVGTDLSSASRAALRKYMRRRIR